MRRARTPALAFAALLPGGLAACATGANTNAPGATMTAIYHTSPDPALASLPFSEAVQVGELLFLAGQIGTVPGELRLVEGGIGPESRRTMENIRAVLERRGSSLDDVVKVTVFLADMGEWPAFNEVYRGYFPKHFPARSALGSNGLALGARVEVEVVAVANHAR